MMLPLLFVAVFMCGGYQSTVVDALGRGVASVGCTTTTEHMYVLRTPSMRLGMMWPDTERERELERRRSMLPRWRGGDLDL